MHESATTNQNQNQDTDLKCEDFENYVWNILCTFSQSPFLSGNDPSHKSDIFVHIVSSITHKTNTSLGHIPGRLPNPMLVYAKPRSAGCNGIYYWRNVLQISGKAF